MLPHPQGSASGAKPPKLSRAGPASPGSPEDAALLRGTLAGVGGLAATPT